MDVARKNEIEEDCDDLVNHLSTDARIALKESSFQASKTHRAKTFWH